MRLLSSRTVRYMTRNHLPGGQDPGRPVHRRLRRDARSTGSASGSGFAVLENAAPAKVIGSEGIYYWGGAASTTFWVDPVEELTAMLFTQLVPSSTYPLRPQLRQLVYSALL